eukprot:CAMPEP_0182473614 /NCGR_PEP_ID=MMETSP1319-20130603/24257_1 /TAXON_ID=172717 /ORGANISM="Bolidomonas pacifica, Strain RCC208" /LENGTH=88 /DNA_ID=CAMNT_0024674433 /DNA_START=1 /DNA_END=264 /DNA_ORIENTATION=+
MATIAPTTAARRNVSLPPLESPPSTNLQAGADVVPPPPSLAASLWTPIQTSAYLSSLSYLPKSMSHACVHEGVSGAVLLELDAEGLRE